MLSNTNSLIGYWVLDSDPERAHKIGEFYLRFTSEGLLQEGNQNKWRIYVLSFRYWIDGDLIATICPPNPRTELTPFSIAEDGKLTLSYGNYDTVWAKSDKKYFFESMNIWDPGILFERQTDYMSLLDSKPQGYQIERALRLDISPQILINTEALWKSWKYSRAAFASFHLDDFQHILNQGVLIDDDDNEDRTLLSYLAEDGHTEAVRLMLDHGAEINHLDIYPLTALDGAIAAKRTDTVVLLRERGAKLASELD